MQTLAKIHESVKKLEFRESEIETEERCQLDLSGVPYRGATL